MQIQFHGHACFSFYLSNGKHLLFDPFLDGNPMAKISSADINPDVILVTHVSGVEQV